MNHDINRVKGDLETLQNAMGLGRAGSRDWAPWLKRDRWLNWWWAIPGLLLMASGVLLPAGTQRFLGLLPAQLTGIAVGISAISVVLFHIRKTTSNDGRPASLIREYKRFWGIDSHGAWVAMTLMLELFLYFFWAVHFHISTEAFIPGIFIIMGSSYLVVAVLGKLWLLLGCGIPLLGYGLYTAMLHGQGDVRRIPLGLMFVGMAALCFLIQGWQIRQIERQDESH